MFKIYAFEKRLCSFMRKNYPSKGNSCNTHSIWNICASNRLRAACDFVFSCSPCRAAWFPLIFWLFLLLSMLGTVFSLLEFMRVYCCRHARLSTFHDRKMHIVTYRWLRKARMVGAFLMMNAWVMLFYGVLIVSPDYMLPWIIVSCGMLIFEVVIYVYDVLMGRRCIRFRHVVSTLLPVVTICMARCVSGVFREAIRDGVEDALRLLPPS